MWILPLVLTLLQPPAEEVRSVPFVATDDKGDAVRGLQADEVAVIEGGVARKVVRLEPEVRPLQLIVLVDNSLPIASLYRLHVVDAVVKFLQSLPEGSRYAVWTTGDRPTTLVGFGSDAAAAERALRRAMPQGGNTLLDALVEAAKALEEKEEGRSAIVAVTGAGVGFTSRDRTAVVEQAAIKGITFHAAQFDEGGAPEVAGLGSDQVTRVDYDYVLTNLASRSGGRHERTLSAMGTAQALQKVSAELSGQYRVSYVTTGDTKQRKLEIQVAREGVKTRVAARAGR